MKYNLALTTLARL